MSEYTKLMYAEAKIGYLNSCIELEKIAYNLTDEDINWQEVFSDALEIYLMELE